MKSLSYLRDAARHAATPLALLCVQLALSLYYWDHHVSARDLLTPTWELPALLALVLALAWRPRPRAVEQVAKILLTVLLVGFLFLGFAQRFAKLEFGYDVLLAIDLKYVPELFSMMFRADSLALAIFNCVVLALAVGAAVLALYASVVQLHRVVAEPERRKRLLIAFVPTVALLAIVLGMNGPLSAVAVGQIDMAMHRKARIRFIATQMEKEVARDRGEQPFRLGAWQPDILVFVVESYGSALFEHARFAPFRDFVAREAEQLSASGYALRSRYMASPVFGGSSWMASSTLMCGVKVNNQRRHEGLRIADIECLPQLFNRVGYDTLLAAGNTTHVDDLLKRLLPFERMLIRSDLDYHGPRYAWSYIPDQFVIDKVERMILAPRPKDASPLFAVFMLTSSHHPWSHVPPYVEDWQKLGNGESYFERIGIEFPGNQFVTGTHYAEGYDASVRYALRSVFAYLRQLPPERQPLVLVLGDHQPRHPVAEMGKDDWWVPVHVLSRDAAAVERFAAQGYVPGVVPRRTPPVVPLERFLDRLMAVLSADAAAPAPAASPVATPASR